MKSHEKALSAKYDKKFAENPIAKRMKAKNEAKDLGRRLGTGHVDNVLKRK